MNPKANRAKGGIRSCKGAVLKITKEREIPNLKVLRSF